MADSRNLYKYKILDRSTDPVNKYAVVGELVNHLQLVVEHPHVLVLVVRAHLDLVRPAPARHLEDLVVLRPLLYELAVAIHHEDDVVIAPFPAALRLRLARGAEPVVIAGGAAAGR